VGGLELQLRISEFDNRRRCIISTIRRRSLSFFQLTSSAIQNPSPSYSARTITFQMQIWENAGRGEGYLNIRTFAKRTQRKASFDIPGEGKALDTDTTYFPYPTSRENKVSVWVTKDRESTSWMRALYVQSASLDEVTRSKPVFQTHSPSIISWTSCEFLPYISPRRGKVEEGVKAKTSQAKSIKRQRT